MNSKASGKKFISVAYIPEPPACSKPTRPVSSEDCRCPEKPKFPLPPKASCCDIPKIEVSKCPAVPKPSCFEKIPRPNVSCPPIQRPPMCCPVQITIEHDLPAGSCSQSETIERESNTISLTSGGKTVILCSEGYERQVKYAKRKDTNGMSHAYCKEVETKSNMASGDGRNSKPCVPAPKPGPLCSKE